MKSSLFILLLVTTLFGAGLGSIHAHEVRPAYLELKQTEASGTYEVLWKIPALPDNRRLGIYVRFPDETVDLAEPRGFYSESAYIERRRIQRNGGLQGQTISIEGLSQTKIDVLARVDMGDGRVQTVRILPDSPSFIVAQDPTSWRVSATYLMLGFEHILLGVDHLLFVFALMLLVKGWKRLIGTITAFTVAHSLTLAAAALGVVHVPGPPVEACIALSIAFVAAEIIHGRRGRPGLTERAPWLVAFTFGLLHGLGFAGALSEIGLPTQAIPLALLSFNLGVEAGQLAFIAIVLGLRTGLRGVPIPYRASSWKWAPYAVGSIAMFWVIQRTAGFWIG